MEYQRESIFVSAIRSFSKVFFGVVAFFLALFIISLVHSALSSPFAPPDNTKIALLPDLKGNDDLVPMSAPAVLQISIEGVIGEPMKLDTETMETILMASQKDFLRGNRVKAILLKMNTPGGTVLDSDNIYRMLKSYKEKHNIPIFAYVNGLCASGGMYIASAADKVFASPSSVIGSVGVIMGPFFNVVQTMQKIGMEAKTLTQGIDKDALSPFRTWKPGEENSMQAIMAFFYNRFVDIVTSARSRLDRQRLINEYGARIFDAPTAQEYGYIDVANVGYDTALGELLAAANIDPSSPYQVVELSPKPDWLGPLVGENSIFRGRLEHSLDTGDRRSPAIRDQFAYLYQPSSAP